MKKKKVLFGILLFSIFVLSFFIGLNDNTVQAAINGKYGKVSTVDTNGAEDKADSGGLLGLLASGILGFGKLVEILVGFLLNLISSDHVSSFPWADQIIFNTIPVLDVNFINPSPGSFFLKNGQNGTTEFTAIGNIVRKIYFTGMSVSLGFFGLVVAIMAIKLAISSIGSEKAKYKEAIVKWATAIVLLFMMHYLLSFLFFMNEKLVEVASQIVVDLAKETGLEIGGAKAEEGQVLSGLGEYFFKKATEDASGWLAVFDTKPIPAVLFTVFVVQSLIFLFAYFKRFFYVLILSLLAPYVVVYDFFKKI